MVRTRRRRGYRLRRGPAAIHDRMGHGDLL